MTPAERATWNRIHRRAASLHPELVDALLRTFDEVRDLLPLAEIMRALEAGLAGRLFDELVTRTELAVAYAPIRDRLRSGIIEGVRTYGRTLPPTAARSVTVAFDYLNPRVIDAIRVLESRVITAMDTAVRETVRGVVEQGLREGLSTRTIAQEVRASIGLGPTQLQEVENFRDALLGRNGRSIADYNLRNRTVDRLLGNGPLTPAQVERYVEQYRKARIANNASTIAQSAARDAQKLAQRMSWQDAIEKGLVDGNRLVHQWIGVNDDRERPAHRVMNNEVQPWSRPYSNGQLVPGEGDYNCRCIDRFYLARA